MTDIHPLIEVAKRSRRSASSRYRFGTGCIVLSVQGGHEVLAIGSDFDGFIKPTLGGFDHIDDLAKLREHLDELCPDHGQGFLSGNALRVLETTFAGRDR